MGDIVEDTLLRFVLGWWTHDYHIPFFITFAIPLIYLLLWVVVPYAVTPEDMLRMKGKDVNPQNLNEEIINDTKTDESRKSDYGTGRCSHAGSNNGGCLKAILGGGCLMVLFGPLFLFLLALALFSFVIGVASSIISFPGGMFQMVKVMAECTQLFWLGLICGLVVIIIPIVVLVRRMRKGSWSMSRNSAIVVGVAWCLAFIGFVVVWRMGAEKIEHLAKNKVDVDEFIEAVDGLDDRFNDRDFLDEYGWQIIAKRNCKGGRVTSYGQYLSSYGVRYLEAGSKHGRNPMVFTARTSEYLETGLYRVYAECRASQDGAYIYATTDVGLDSIISASMIPAYGNKGGNIFSYACDSALCRDKNVRRWVDGLKNVESTVISDDSVNTVLSAYDAAKFVNEGRGYGWSYVYADSVRLDKDGVLYYGVTTNTNMIEKHNGKGRSAKRLYGGWVSAHNFKVERIGDLPNK